MYSKGITQVVPDSLTSIEEVAEMMRSDLDLWSKVENVRKAKSKKQANAAKKLLPYVTFSGVFRKRANEGIDTLSLLICMDIDSLDSPESYKSLLSEIQGCVLCFISPSGKGIKAVYLYPTKDGRRTFHHQAFAHYSALIKEKGIEVDPACKDIARACYLSYDEDLFLNIDAQAPMYLESSKEQEEAPKTIIPSTKPTDADATSVERVEYVLKHLKSSITSTYNEWKDMAAALYNEFGTAGFQYFDQLSKMDAEYRSEEALMKFNQCKKISSITIGTFFKAAEDVGCGGTDFWRAFYKEREELASQAIANDFVFEQKKASEVTSQIAIPSTDAPETPTKFELPAMEFTSNPNVVDVLKQEAVEVERSSAEEKYYEFFQPETLLSPQELANDRNTRIKFGIPNYRQLIKDGYTPAHTALSLMEWVLGFPRSFWDGFAIDDDTRNVHCEQGGTHFDLSEWVKMAVRNLFMATSAIKDKAQKKEIASRASEMIISNLDNEIGTCDERVKLPLTNKLIIPIKAPSPDDICKMMQARVAISDKDVYSLLAFTAATIRAHRYNGGKYYRSLNVVGDGGIGKDTYLPRLMGSHKGNTFEGAMTVLNSGFVKMSKEKILSLQYLWISDKSADNRAENELDRITREIGTYNPKGKDPFFVRKRYNTVNTSNNERSISGTNQDDTAATRRYISIEIRYKEGEGKDNSPWKWLRNEPKAFDCDELQKEYAAFQACALVISQDIQLLDTMLNDAATDIKEKLMRQRTISPVVDRMITEIVADKQRCLMGNGKPGRIEDINGKCCYVVGSYESYFMEMFGNKGSSEYNKRALIQALQCFNIESVVRYKKGRAWVFEVRQKDLPGTAYEAYIEGSTDEKPKDEVPF